MRMLSRFEILHPMERELLFKVPILVSVFAIDDNTQRKVYKNTEVIRLAHLETFVSYPILQPYYREVKKRFKKEFEAAARKYYPMDDEKRMELQAEMNKASGVIEKLDKSFAVVLYNSLKEYTEHVKNARYSSFQDFVFPLRIPGLTD